MGKTNRKLIHVLLFIICICSCTAGKVKSEPSPDIIGDTSPNLQESFPNTNTNNNTNLRKDTSSKKRYYNQKDLSYFYADDSIKSLEFIGGTYSDLTPLLRFHDLEALRIDFNKSITDISPLSSLTNLKELKLDLLDSLTDISPLRSLVNLEKLTLTNCFNVENIEAISSLVNLKNLDIIYRKSDFIELLPLTQLEILRIVSPRSGLDVTYIGQLHSLKDLEIDTADSSGGKISNINQLGNLVNLEKLTIARIYDDDVDLLWISSLQRIKEISLRFCTIDDISPLADLPNLEEIDLWATKVKDITPLLESKSIKTISGPILETRISETYNQFRERGIEFSLFASDR